MATPKYNLLHTPEEAFAAPANTARGSSITDPNNPSGTYPLPAARPSTPSPTFGPQQRDQTVQGWKNSSFAPDRSGIEQYLGTLGSNHGWTILDNDKVRDPSGRTYDWIGDSGTAQAQKRTGYTTDARYADVTGSGKGKAKVSTTSGGGASGGSSGSSYMNDIRKLILDQLNGLKGTPSITDPELAAQSEAYRRRLHRSNTDERADLAERAAANGTLMGGQSSGGFDTALQGIHERSGESQAGYDAGLVGDEIQSRRTTINSLLAMALSSGDAESARLLQTELARLDAELRREGLSQQNSQFNADLGYRNRTFDDTFGRNLNRDYEDDYRFRVLYPGGV